MKVNGIELLQMIKDGKIKTNTKINVWSIIGDLAGKITTIEYNGCDLRWKPGMFNTCYLYKDNYYFEIIEKEKEIEELTLKGKEIGYGVMSAWLDFTPNDNEQKICSAIESIGIKINEIIKEVNKLKKEGKQSI